MNRFFVIGFALLIGSFFLSLMDGDRFYHSYLFSFLFWVDLCLGALFLLMIGSLTSGEWFKSTYRIFRAMLFAFPWMALLFVPIAIGSVHIYPWLRPEALSDPKIQHKHAYLNSFSFDLRAVCYFACWLVLAFVIKSLIHRKKDFEGKEDLERSAKLRSISGPGLVVFALTSSFSAFDWKMSLEPLWYSTIFGMIACAAQGLLAMSVGLLIYVFAAPKVPQNTPLGKKTHRDLGNLLLALVMVWTYLSFMQFLVIWTGNLSEEAPYYLHRSTPGWIQLACVLFSLGFGLPFLALLFRRTKDQLRNLGAVALLVALTCVLDHYWTTLPSLYPKGLRLHWLDFSLFIGMGAIWYGAFRSRFLLEDRP